MLKKLSDDSMKKQMQATEDILAVAENLRRDSKYHSNTCLDDLFNSRRDDQCGRFVVADLVDN